MNDDLLARVAMILETVSDCGRLIDLTRLGGLTNEVYRAETEGGVLCVRIPGKGTEEYINRRNEGRAAYETGRIGISPRLLHFDPETGVSISHFLPEVTTMTSALFKQGGGRLHRAGIALRQLHDSDAVFLNRFELFGMIDEYTRLLESKSASVPAYYKETLAAAGAARNALAANPTPLAPCHCDPLAENFLDTGERMWIVDWEYSGMNDPMWDLGDLSVEAELQPRNDEELLLAYFGRTPTASEKGRVVIYKALCDLLWTLWGLIQHVNANPVDDFWAYSLRRFARCRALMASPEFDQAVAAVAVGD